MGRLSGPELVAPGGASYAAGDRVVALAPATSGQVVTSETGTVVAVDEQTRSLHVRMDDDNAVYRLEADEIGADRLAHAYAVTVHRSQGSTVARAHALEDGGGRELAYVKMSRARERSTVYAVADTLSQATEDLARDWSVQRRPAWVIDSGTPATDPAAVEADPRVAAPMRAALRRGRLQAERHAIAAAIPPDPTADIQAVERDRDRLQRQQDDLRAGTGVYARQPIGEAMRALGQAESNLNRIEGHLRNYKPGRADRRRAQAELDGWQQRRSAAVRDLEALTGPERSRLNAIDGQLAARLSGLWGQGQDRQDWINRHPEAARRLDRLTADIGTLDAQLDQTRAVSGRGDGRDRDYPWLRPSAMPPAQAVERDLGIEL
jgi:hypothetical protein